MTEKASKIHSIYVIDGVQQEFTPAQLLDALTDAPGRVRSAGGRVRTIVDESLDPVYRAFDFNPDKVDEYLGLVLEGRTAVPFASADTCSRFRLASALLDTLWRKGHFRLGDLAVKAWWRWEEGTVGADASFYESVAAVTDYVEALGLRFASYRCTGSSAGSSLSFRAVLSQDASGDEEGFVFEPFRSGHPVLSERRAVPAHFVPDPRSWIVYIPCDPCDFRLGGSLLAQSLGLGGGPCPHISDADYFMDCHEVLREFVEDGIILSASTVCEGGLLKTVNAMTGSGCGAEICLTDILGAYRETSIVRVLFAEVPGVLIQIRDADFDYLDAELLLQDVAYYPLGHPVSGCGGVRVRTSAKSGIQTILETLLQNAEGED